MRSHAAALGLALLVAGLIARPARAEEEQPAAAAPAAPAAPAPTAASPSASAPARPIAEITAEAMAKVHFLLGRWEGEGSMQMGPAAPAERVNVVERATSKIDGRVVLFEGLGTAPAEAGGESRVVHQAIGVISFDPHRGRYQLRAIRTDGQSVDPDVEVGDRRFVWSFPVPQGRVRYTIVLDEEGRWQERGDYSPDGSTWHQFFTMTLRRVGDA